MSVETRSMPGDVHGPGIRRKFRMQKAPEFVETLPVYSEDISMPLENVSIITCAYGSDPARVEATRRAVSSWASQTRVPHIVMVELVEANANSRYNDILPDERVTHITLEYDPWLCRGIMQKEALMNIGAARAPGDTSIFIFLDSDVRSENPHWFGEIAAAFVDVSEDILVQGFRFWRDTLDKVDRSCSVGSSEALRITDNRLWHPGFCWAMTKDMWFRMRGLNSYAITGSGDAMLLHELVPGKYEVWSESQSSWMRDIIRSGMPSPRLTFAPVDIVHENHGDLSSRAYWQSWLTVDSANTPMDQLVKQSDEGLIVWRNPSNRMAAILADRPRLAKLSLKRCAVLEDFRGHLLVQGSGAFKQQRLYREIVLTAPEHSVLVEIGLSSSRAIGFLAVEAHNANKGLKVTAASRRRPQADRAKQEFKVFADSVGFQTAGSLPKQFQDESVWSVSIREPNGDMDLVSELKLWYPKLVVGGWLSGILPEDDGKTKETLEEWADAEGLTLMLPDEFSFHLRRPDPKGVFDFETIYDGVYGRGLRPVYSMDRQRAFIKGVVLASAGSLNGNRCLELGCGEGMQAHLINEAGFEVDALDVSSVAIERASGTYSSHDLRFIQEDAANAARIYPKAMFDLIVALDFPWFDYGLGVGENAFGLDVRAELARLMTLLKHNGCLIVGICTDFSGNNGANGRHQALLSEIFSVFGAVGSIVKVTDWLGTPLRPDTIEQASRGALVTCRKLS